MNTKAGGKKQKETIEKKYGKDYWAYIGRKGGSKPTTKLKGFAANRELASKAGTLGGQASKRKKIIKVEKDI